ncbi:MAG: hypothetical protein H7Y38_01500 [Armatimonadetes bacterium]|nr:hypothetical protein [Armatimonadota bacterium]
MQKPYLTVFGAVCALVAAAPVWAQQPAAVTLPAIPAPGTPTFAERVAGRAAVADSVYALTAAPRLSVQTKWQVITQDERKRVTTRTGTESLTLNTGANRVSLVSASEGTTTRFVCDGKVLLATRTAPAVSTKQPPLNTPIRTFFRLPLEGDTETVSDALVLAKAGDAPLSRVARTTLLPDLENNGYGWRGRGAFAQSGDGSVLETLPENANRQRRVATVRRYRFDKARRPVTIEEWVTNENRERKTSRVTYRRETYAFAAYPTRTDIFATKPAANYTETSPPSGATLPNPPGPDVADAKARGLLSRWTRAWARFTALNATVSVSALALPTTPESQPVPPGDANNEGGYTVYYQRPGKLFLASAPVAIVTQNNRADTRRLTGATPQTAISDGTTLIVSEGNRRRGDDPVNGDDARIRQAFQRNGFDDRAGVLNWIFDSPQSVFGDAEFAEYRADLDAVTVRQTITQNAGGGRRRRGNARGVSETVITSTIYFSEATGLPRRIERYISTTGTAALRRDDPPNRYIAADYALTLNSESSPGIFRPATP